jgi:hypothetical protein
MLLRSEHFFVAFRTPHRMNVMQNRAVDFHVKLYFDVFDDACGAKQGACRGIFLFIG